MGRRPWVQCSAGAGQDAGEQPGQVGSTDDPRTWVPQWTIIHHHTQTRAVYVRGKIIAGTHLTFVS